MPRARHPNLVVGRLVLERSVSTHLLRVLRLRVGDAVELFDDAGLTADARIDSIDSAGRAVVTVEAIRTPEFGVARLWICSAVPKGERSDWMIEKLSELGVARFTPLRTARSVVHPAGAGKFDRWRRIAVEAARQSGRVGVMRIDPLCTLTELPALQAPTLVATTEQDGISRDDWPKPTGRVLIGPEGGWTDQELQAMANQGFIFTSLGGTVLRVETAAIVAAVWGMKNRPTNNPPTVDVCR